MPRAQASRELAARIDDAWSFVAEPYHFPDWWPGIAAVEPDRRGAAAGARWRVRAADRPTLLRRGGGAGILLVVAAERPHRFHFRLIADRIEAELLLREAGPDRTLAQLTVVAPWLVGFSRSLPRTALSRLHALCQISASFDAEV
jgi:hypothetical protein